MSRLDSFIRRMTAQRACLERAAALIAEVPGPVLELGLGTGRTYDHLRCILPERPIYVFERTLVAHPDCRPPPHLLILGDCRETLPQMAMQLAGAAALAHFDLGSVDYEASLELAATVAPLVAPLLRPGGVVASEPPLSVPGWHPIALPPGIGPERYHLFRVG